jgi:hypothetical protein
MADSEAMPDDAEDAGLAAEEVEPELAAQPETEMAAGESAAEDAAVEEAVEELAADEAVIDEPVAEAVEQAEVEADLSDDMPEDLEQISMTDHQVLVADPEEVDEKASDKAAQPLVTALLDAEKALIEAGANGLSDGDSPVAEIIRRISLRTREFSQAANR